MGPELVDARANGMLSRLLAPVPSDEFLRDHWERRPLVVSRDAPPWQSGLCGVADVDAMIRLTGARDDLDVRVVRSQGRTIEPFPFSRDPGGAPNLASLTAAYGGGHTIIVNALHRRWGPVARLAAELEEALGQPVGVNLYLTPPDAQGFQPHVDGHDVFVLQLSGEKEWEVFGDPPIELPLEKDRPEVDPGALGPPMVAARLTAGDLLYIPRGFVHRARTGDEPSMHLTVGIHSRRWVEVAHAAVDALARRNVRLRRTVPGDRSADELRAELLEMLRGLADPDLAAEAVRSHEARVVGESGTAPGGGFEELERARSLTLSTRVRRRPGLRTRVEVDGEAARIHFGANHVEGPAALGPALRFVAATASFPVAGLPDTLTDEAKLVLARRLIREGLLTTTEEGGRNGEEPA